MVGDDFDRGGGLGARDVPFVFSFQAGALSMTKLICPFFLIALCWYLLSSVILFITQEHFANSVKWLTILTAVGCLDLYAIAKVVQGILGITKAAEQKIVFITQIGLWVLIKLVCLILFGIALWVGREASGLALSLGAGTLMIVPVVGGVLWTQRELRNARAT
jgi:hypothetical protein